ncbi:MAG: hypothetical protein WBF16_10440, partial [Candidatus Deferrimicrobiaceae bacterium]
NKEALMKKILSTAAAAAVLVLVFATFLLADARATIDLAPGDEVYACKCGPECDCGTLSRVANICSCGMDLVRARVVSVGEGTATLLVGGKEKIFKTTGRYVCACREGSCCGTISQKPGKCACGRIILPLAPR